MINNKKKIVKLRDFKWLHMVFSILLLPLSSCSFLLYFPSTDTYSDPNNYSIEYEDINLVTADGLNIHGWHLRNDQQLKRPKSLILHFHGNAQNITAHFMFFAWITKHGHDVQIIDYRGFGQSEGSPDPEGTHLDALAALEHAWGTYKTGGYQRFVIVGQSIGGVIAMRALQDFKKKSDVDLLVVDSSFISYKDIAFDRATAMWFTFLFSPLAYLLFSDEMAPEQQIEKITMPTLVVHGNQDEVIPEKFGKEIYQKLQTRKWYWTVENGNHIEAFARKDFQQKLLKLIEEL